MTAPHLRATSTPFDPRFQDATDLLLAAGDRARRWFEAASARVERKADGTPVTEADRDVEAYLREGLTHLFPDDGILGEEFPEVAGSSGGRWILDPIDGTKSFVRGVPLYSTLLAYETADGIAFGGIVVPSAGVAVFAQAGRGCIDGSGQSVAASDQVGLDDACVLATWLEDWPEGLPGRVHALGGTVRTWGDGFGYTMVATGRADALIDYTVQPYDIAPMPVILREAGGVFTDFDGAVSIRSGTGIAAATPELHGALLAMAQRRDVPTT